MPAYIDLTGRVFHLLTVLHRVPGTKRGTRWICRCACGKEKIIEGRYLRSGATGSCGCRFGLRSLMPYTATQLAFLEAQKKKKGKTSQAA